MIIEERRAIALRASLNLFDGALKPYKWYEKSSIFTKPEDSFVAVRIGFKPGAETKRDVVERAVKIAVKSNFNLELACMAFVGRGSDAGAVIFMIKLGNATALGEVRAAVQSIDSCSMIFYPFKV